MESRLPGGPRRRADAGIPLPPPADEPAVALLPAPARHRPLRWLRRSSRWESDEILSAWTHALPAGAAVAGLGPLLAAAGSAGAAAAATTYGLAVIAVFAVSAALHFARRPRLRNRLGLLDRLAIFLLIAASYTPFTALQLAPPWGAGLLGLVWSLALGFGILNVAIYPRRRSFTLLQPVNLVAYLALGWSGLLVAGPAFAAALPAGGLAWLLGGGLFYTVGVAFFVGERIPYNHTVWHLFVVAGASCHYIAVLEYGLAGA